jgi:hypothetical protein
MELSPAREAASCVATQVLAQISPNLKIRCRFHKSTPLHCLELDGLLHITSSYLWHILILSIHLRLGLPTCLLPSLVSILLILSISSFFT